MSRHKRMGRQSTLGAAVAALAAIVSLAGAPACQTPTPAEPLALADGPAFEKPTLQETLAFLKSIPKYKFRDGKPVGQFWQDTTIGDLEVLKSIHPGCHVNKDGEPPRHLRLEPSDWRYFTALEQLEVLEVGHNIEGIDDSCFFYLGQLPQTMRRLQLEMIDATGTGVEHLQNLNGLKSLSLNFSRDIEDIALIHAAKITSLEYLDVNGCPRVTGEGVKALAKLKGLKTLKIGGCSLSDADLEHFKDLSVEHLDLSDYVAEWVVRYRGGGRHDFTVSFAGLRKLLSSPANLPNLKTLTVQRGKRSLLEQDILTRSQKSELAALRPGLEVR